MYKKKVKLKKNSKNYRKEKAKMIDNKRTGDIRR